MKLIKSSFAFVVMSTAICAAAASLESSPKVHSVGGAPNVRIDRFSDQAAHLFRRSGNPMLPGPDAPINFDQAPFITHGFAPNGDYVSYYNFDVQSTQPAPIFVLFREGASMPVEGQLNIVDVIPGEKAYNDFWNVVKVTVPANYVANQVASLADLMAAGYLTQVTNILVNCPIVPVGSTATVRYQSAMDTGLHKGWYRGKVVSYFNFSEKALAVTASRKVPLSPIYVTFNKNPNAMDAGSGPASGFVTDMMTGRTHNVVETTPEDASYSPLWYVEIYDNQSFAMVRDLATAEAAPLVVDGAATVNCPVVKRSQATRQ